MWNPWKCICPYCRADLEAGRYSKFFAVASFPFGVALAMVAIVLEEAGRWQTSDSMLYFGIVFVILLAVGFLAWTRTQFRLKR